MNLMDMSLIDPSYIHKEATIIGNVIIGKDVYVGPEHQLEVIGVRLQLKMDVIFKITALFISFLKKMLFLKKMHILVMGLLFMEVILERIH